MTRDYHIGTLIVDAAVIGDAVLGQRVQQEIGRAILAMTLKADNNLADSESNTSRYWIFDRVEVDLGQVDLSELESSLPIGVRSALEKLRADGELATSPMPEIDVYRPRELRPLNEADPRHLDAEQALLESFLYTLVHGRRPWWYRPDVDENLERRFRSLLGSDSSLYGNRLLAGFSLALSRTLDQSSIARERLFRRYSTDMLALLMGACAPDRAAEVAAAVAAINTILATEHVLAPLRPRLHAALRRELIDVLAAPQSIMQISSGALEGELLRRTVNHSSGSFTVQERVGLAAALPLPPPPKPGIVAERHREQVGTRQYEGQFRDDHVPPDADVLGTEGLVIDNAGVVLLHPFLPRFFNQLMVAKDYILIDVSRAALLVHHLVTGAHDAEEHQLVFAKVLCGVPIETVLQPTPPIQPAEVGEARALLTSAIAHWEALRSTSPDELRGSFLTRSGRLDFDDGQWLLRMEHRSYDILLDHLPWGMTHVKLPWMRAMMRVEWSV